MYGLISAWRWGRPEENAINGTCHIKRNI